MAHWRAVLPLEVLDIDYEKLVADQEGETRRLIAFIGLDWDPACLSFHKTDRPVMSPASWQVRQPLYSTSIGRWWRYRRHLLPLLAGLAGLAPLGGDEDWDDLAADRARALTIAVAHHRAGRLIFAEPIYRALLRGNPDDPAALHLLGLLLIDRGQPSESIALIERSLAHRPDIAPALADLSRAQRAAGNADAAVAAATRAVAIDPALPDGQLQLGCALLAQENDVAAIEVLRRATELAPKSLEALVALATALTRQDDHAEAVEVWQEALVLNADDPSILANYARSLAGLECFGEALEFYRKADALAPGNPAIQYGTAWSLLRLGDGRAAAEQCRRTLETSPDWAALWQFLANCEATLGHFEAAAQAYRKALSLDPQSADALAGLVAVGAGLDEDATEAEASAVFNDLSRPTRDRSSAGFALAKRCDRRGAYDEAIKLFRTANELLRADHAAHGSVFDREHFRHLVDHMIASIGPDTFAATAAWGDPSELPVFIVGMPRSGTSLVEQIVASHKQVFGAGEQKDMQNTLTALAGEQAARSPSEWDRGAVRREATSYLQRLLVMGGDAIRVVDKMPDNILCLGQIAVLFPRARIIVCRRDLRDVGLSCFLQNFQDNTLMWADDLADIGFRAAQTERLMAHWRKVLPVSMLEIQYETLVANLERESRRLIDFLGLDWDPACLAFHETERTVLTASHWQVRQPLYDSSVGRWRHYRDHLGPLLQELQGVIPANPE